MEQRTMDRQHSHSVDVGRMRGEFFGQEAIIRYSTSAVAYAILAMRLVMGWIFLQAGLTKLTADAWTAEGFLTNVPEGNPFMDFWTSMAGNAFVDFLNIWGAIAIGLGLMFGLFFRWSAFWGAVMMLMYWAAGLEGGLSAGLPVAHGWVVDEHIVYMVLLFGLGALGAGRIMGLDTFLERTTFVKNNPWARYFLA